MNKAKQMKKKLGVLGGITAGVVLAFVGIMVLTSSMAGKAEERKKNAENARNAEQTKISSMRTQIDESGDAKKRFAEISIKHASDDYSANTVALKQWLRGAKERFRFSNNFKLTLIQGKVSDKPEFANLNYEIQAHEGMKLEFGAISDMHVFSFLSELARQAPGFVRITRFEIKRSNDLDANAIRQLQVGANTAFVEGKIEFNWVGLQPKKAASEAAAPTSATGG